LKIVFQINSLFCFKQLYKFPFVLFFGFPLFFPETNSIEEFFSQLKHYIKKESPNTYEDIYNVISNILKKKITKEHLTNYLKHSYKIYKS